MDEHMQEPTTQQENNFSGNDTNKIPAIDVNVQDDADAKHAVDQQKGKKEPTVYEVGPKVSTTFTVIGMTAGLLLGAVIGFWTGQIPLSIALGLIVLTAVGLLLDYRKDRKAKNESETSETVAENGTVSCDSCSTDKTDVDTD